MRIIERIEKAFRPTNGNGKEKLTTEQFIQGAEKQIAALKVERERMQNNIRQGLFIKNNEARLAEINQEIEGLTDKITFANEREQMGAGK